MTALAAAAGWFVLAMAIAMTPSRDHHWRAAYGLMAVGLPILVWVFVTVGATAGLLILAAALSVLRWPAIYLARWIRRRLGL